MIASAQSSLYSDRAEAVKIGPVTFSNNQPLAFILGPCQMESRDHAVMMAGEIEAITRRLGVGCLFKTSFDKANRTSLGGPRGLGLEAAIDVFDEIRTKTGFPVLTDVHTPEQCKVIQDHVDALQIPAFLCRQTDLLVAAAQTGLPVNVKKGQFLAPWDLAPVVEKITAQGNEAVLLTERGTCFGYNRLVVDMAGLAIIAGLNKPVIFDATHAVQLPGGKGSASGGERDFAPLLARSAISVGIAGLFLECHNRPEAAPSDGSNMVPLGELERLLTEFMAFDVLAKKHPLRPL